MPQKDLRRRILDIGLPLLVIIVIILAVVYFVTNPPDETTRVYSVEQIWEHGDQYLNQNITVEGYFNPGAGENEGTITSAIVGTGSAFEYIIYLPVDTSDVNISLVENNKYQFTGIFTSDAFGYKLVATKIVPA